MSEEQLKAFLDKVKADTSLQDKLKAAADVDAALAIAKEAGFMISADDVRTKISDNELERAAGGEQTKDELGCPTLSTSRDDCSYAC
ncbi:nif11-like leader peptide domain protein [Synechococcus sp. BIOS-E4-1]|uniref:Nif11-like leader peptide family RiPP precursor n=1 Tax=Synechococcus sp. BIOS-E4-1 TaxID=1400864 RepID=UPI0016486F96|nr:Nif11-like leader peptide family RiPP precursor [Synechococcus sp. BIOS-E4-1]QNI54395.1 nif11-like leader peptide domain protein [Synechococcus sp. BIOS-E4-1]